MRKTADIQSSPVLPSVVEVRNPTGLSDVPQIWMIDSDRIQTYVIQLRHHQDLRKLLLAHVAMRINQQRLNTLSAEKTYSARKAVPAENLAVVDLSSLYRHTEKIGALKRRVLVKLESKLKPALEADSFWEDAAIWILARLNAWEQDQQIPPECAIAGLLPTLTEAEIPNTAEWIELRTLSAYAYYATDHLVKILAIHSLSLEALEKLLGIEKRPIKNSTLLKGKEFEKIGSGYGMMTGAQAVINSQWKTGEYPHWQELIGNSFIEHQIIPHNPETTRIELVPGKATWEIMQQFGPEAAYIFLVFAAQATDLEKPWEGHIQVKGSNLLKLYSWDQYQDLTLGKKLKRIGSLVELVCRLSVCICSIDRDTKRYSIANSALWLLEELEYSGQPSFSKDQDFPDLQTSQPQDSDELLIRVRPGSWIEKFLRDPGHPERQALKQYGYLGKSTLQINPYRQRLAAKLSIFLTVMSRVHPNGQYEVSTLLKALESESILEEIQEQKDKCSQLVEQWDSALLTLQQLGWEIKFDPETYPEKIRPAWSLTEGSPTHTATRPSNWLYLWLHAKIIINPTTLIQHRLEISKVLTRSNDTIFSLNDADLAIEPQMRRLPRFIPGEALAEALVEKGLSKAKLAEQLGLDRSMVTRWINGSRPIQPKHREQLWQFLGKELRAVLEKAC